uniref:Regulatory factor X-associated protein n=1 Tax=Sinocyclocheilus anshuiensis TaxID=1608454 RepID=A0A671P985_9TELE
SQQLCAGGDGSLVLRHVYGQTSAAADSNDQDQESFPYDAEDPGEESDAPEARDGAVSPEELNDDETSGESENVPKTCIYDGCTETTTQVAKARKPWMCKKHRNKMYKDKYKKKKSDQAMSSGKLDESSEERPVSVTKQRLGTMGDRPARPSLIEQVLNQKRLVRFLFLFINQSVIQSIRDKKNTKMLKLYYIQCKINLYK